MLFTLIVCLTIISSLATFLLLFGDSPSFRNTPIQKLRNSLLSISRDIFQFYHWLDEKLNGQLLKILNWLVPVGYVMVVTVCFQQFLTHTLPMLSSPGLFRLFTIYFSMVLIYASTILATFSDPGRITTINLKSYPYTPNQLIFFDGKTCSTCHIAKPARSKHCSVCNQCFLLYDHHCVWINNCVGYYNYKWFMLFLISNINMLGYGGWLCYWALTPVSWRKITSTNNANKITGIFLILCSIFIVITTLFTFLHLRYIYLGVTTNELDKWSEIDHLVGLGVLYQIEPSIANENYVERAILDGNAVHISLKDERILIDNNNVKNFKLQLIQSVEDDLVNIYDHGFWNNLIERLKW
ncbi:palmitoyltransferase SWF1 [Candida albicans P76067]|uniref:Palmitoyltransferase n=1 Tax=Candida albicans (strain WO-1) TaxID=294748 RepID=C4YNI3_CANAW|nr:palmitoyltransferase SWF1 [Candida albicans WO-1]KGU01933.1 palmitoyltransferase SWF1 [Candida albicans P87]KHC29895.1 palmitoyltransferase SWF1 [Candida albicans P76067]